jgi:amino acid transporter
MSIGSVGLFRRPFGKPLKRTDLPHQVLAKKYALPVFASDALSSVAYATEEILKVLALAGAAYFFHSMWISLLITGMLVILLLSYRQTIFAYPNGGGAYIVARDNIGEGVAQVAGAALLVDYILTVSVSIAAGVANFSSGVHQFLPGIPESTANERVLGCLVVLFFMWYVNKRGVRESGRAFAAPTYFFLAATFLLLAVGLVKYLTGTLNEVQGVNDVITANKGLTLFLLLRAFASGSTAATGVEAISNGITAFEEPKSRNAATVLFWLIAFLGVMFVGITALALGTNAQPSTSETVISQLGRTVFSAHSPFYVAIIFGTAGVLVMAANTAFADFPRLAALHAADGFLPRWMTDRDNRLVYGIGITVLSLASGLLIVAFQADVSQLIPLYAIGVFVSFCISQSGMVIRWLKSAKLRTGEKIPSYSPEGALVTTLEYDRRWPLKIAINAFGAVVTGVVAVIFAFAKFTEGAWVTVILVPTLVFIFFRIHHHYTSVKEGLALEDADIDGYMESPVKRIRLMAVAGLDRHSLPALKEMLQTGSRNVVQEAVHIDTGERASQVLKQRWAEHGFDEMGLPLVSLHSEFGGGNVVGDLVDYVRGMLLVDPEIQIEMVIPEWTAPTDWWQWPIVRGLHHMTGTRLKFAFLNEDRVTVTNYRYVLGRSQRNACKDDAAL